MSLETRNDNPPINTDKPQPMKRRHLATLSPAVISGLTLTLASASLHAQIAWDGGGGDSNYANNLNWAGDIIPGNGNANGAIIGNGSTQSVIYNTATSYTSTGTGKANSLLVGTGTNGVGSLTLSGSAGTLTFGGDGYNNAAWIGSTSGATNTTGTVTVSAGKLAITGGTDASINLGVSIDLTSGAKAGTLLINGGTVEVGRRILMGANNDAATGILTISSGTLDMKCTGSSGEGDLGMIRLGRGNNTVNLDGGTVIFRGFRLTEASNARSSIFMNGTTLRANGNIADLFNETVSPNTGSANLRLKTGGLVVDTNTFSVTINDALTQESGHTAILRKEGTGTLLITGTQANRTGTTTVNGGTLRVQGTGNGALGTGATTVNGVGTVLDLDRNDTWGRHSDSSQTLTIAGGGVVTNGTQINRGFNTVQNLTLHGGELRVTGSARGIGDGDLYKFEAYTIRDTVTVTGSTASSITNPSALANAGINIGGTTNLGGGVGSSITFNVADVTGSSAADLTVSAVLKNNYTADVFGPLSNGLVKTGDGTMVLTAANRYTGTTNVNAGKLIINGSTSTQSTVTVASGGTLGGTGTAGGAVTANSGGTIAPGTSIGSFTTGALTLAGGSIFSYEVDSGADQLGVAGDLLAVGGNLAIGLNAGLNLIDLGSDTWSIGDKLTLISYSGAWNNGLFTYDSATLENESHFNFAGIDWFFKYDDDTAGANFTGDLVGTSFVTMTAVPEPHAALLGGMGILVLLRRRR